jgi:hypothetical protein
MSTIDKVRARCARRIAAALLTVPVLLPSLVHAAMPPEQRLVAEYREKAGWAQADRFTVIFQHGMFVGFGMMKMARGGGLPTFLLTIASTSYRYDVNAAAQVAGWVSGTPARIWVTVNSGIYVGNEASPGVTDYSMVWATFSVGSDLRLINNGNIMGQGGGGGAAFSGAGLGVRAIALTTCPSGLSIDNTNGYIWGGGGGGGGGGWTTGLERTIGGGGGGQGLVGGQGGAPSNALEPDQTGSSGDETFYGFGGHNAGNGGMCGESGQSGSGTYDAGAGGSTGLAIGTNGVVITWLGGNNASQVKGGVV